MKWKNQVHVSCSVVSDSLRLHGLQPTSLLSRRFCRQGYWSGLPFPSPGDIPNPGIEPRSPALQADPVLTELQGKPNKLYIILIIYCVPSMYRFGISLLNVFSFNLHCDSTRITNLYEEMEAQEKSVSCLLLQSCNWIRVCPGA